MNGWRVIEKHRVRYCGVPVLSFDELVIRSEREAMVYRRVVLLPYPREIQFNVTAR